MLIIQLHSLSNNLASMIEILYYQKTDDKKQIDVKKDYLFTVLERKSFHFVHFSALIPQPDPRL